MAESIKTKDSIIHDWATRAEYYHCNWVLEELGPLKATSHLVSALDLQPSDFVLDIGCGTGAVLKQSSSRLTKSGMLVGVDLSRSALSIAKSWLPSSSNSSLIQMDAEYLGFKNAFHKVSCQYALMFFPDPEKVMAEIRHVMISHGKIALAVHGSLEGVPFFSCITQAISKYIPAASTQKLFVVHRFGKPDLLEQLLVRGGFHNISVSRNVFEYRAHSFDAYWSDFFSNGYGSPLRSIVFTQNNNTISKIKSYAQELIALHERNGTLHIPWEVLIAVGET